MREFDCTISGFTHGTQQSPINIDRKQTFEAKLPPIAFDYPSRIYGNFRKNAWDEDHPIFFIGKGCNAFINFGTTRAQLKQIHFHSPSEHSIDRTDLDAEFHFVHDIVEPSNGEAIDVTREPSTKIVLGVFANLPSNKILSLENNKSLLDKYQNFTKIFSAFHSNAVCNEESEETDLPDDLAKEVQNCADEYFHYRGSLTTGAYAEVVTWLVFPRPVEIHTSLPEAIRDAKQKTRALQALNRRTILYRRPENT